MPGSISILVFYVLVVVLACAPSATSAPLAGTPRSTVRPTVLPTSAQPTDTPQPTDGPTALLAPAASSTTIPSDTPIPSPSPEVIPGPTDTTPPVSTPAPTAAVSPTPLTSPSPILRHTPTPQPTQMAGQEPTAPPTPNPSPTPIPVPTPTTVPTATFTATPPPTPTREYVRPTGYDIFAPGGLGAACESDPDPKFTAHITDLSNIAYLTPAGTVQGGDLKSHGYLENLPTALEVPVYAPVDSHLITFSYYIQSGEAIFTFNFQVSCEVAFYFDHLRAVVSKIGDLKPNPDNDSRGTVVAPPIFFRAGELIGYTGGTAMSRIWDFGVLNTQTWNPLPEVSYVYSPNVEKYRFAVCQYEYFEEIIKAEYFALLGEQGCGP